MSALISADFKNCEFCGVELNTTIKQARLQRAKELQHEVRRNAERKVIREEKEEIAKQKLELEKKQQELADKIKLYAYTSTRRPDLDMQQTADSKGTTQDEGQQMIVETL